MSTTLTTEQLDALVGDFVSSVESNTTDQLGYDVKSPYLIYGLSKAALIALTKIEARQWSGADNVLILSVTPGLCATDLSNHAPGARSPELGADSILHPVNAPAKQLKNGQFYYDGEQKAQSFASTMDKSRLQEYKDKNK